MGSTAATLARATSVVEQIYYTYGYTQNNQISAAAASGPWRPPQWASSNEPLFWIVPVQQGAVGPQQLYAFDGPMEINHEQQSVVTLNPIQTGAPIGDHAYVVPARLVAHLLMSDSMQSFVVGQFADGASRSVSAWQLLKSLQESKTFLTVSTRLGQYDNMLITGRSAVEDKDTRFAGKFTVTFTQILTAQVAVTESSIGFPEDSERPEATVETPVGQTQIQSVPAQIQSQNAVAPTTQIPYLPAGPGETPNTVPFAQAASVPAAGAWSSTTFFSSMVKGAFGGI